MFLFIFQCLNEVVPKLLKELKEHRTPTSICADIDLCDGMFIIYTPGLEVIKLEYSLRLKIKRNDWLLADMCPQAANHCPLF